MLAASPASVAMAAAPAPDNPVPASHAELVSLYLESLGAILEDDVLIEFTDADGIARQGRLRPVTDLKPGLLATAATSARLVVRVAKDTGGYATILVPVKSVRLPLGRAEGAVPAKRPADEPTPSEPTSKRVSLPSVDHIFFEKAAEKLKHAEERVFNAELRARDAEARANDADRRLADMERGKRVAMAQSEEASLAAA